MRDDLGVFMVASEYVRIRKDSKKQLKKIKKRHGLRTLSDAVRVALAAYKVLYRNGAANG